VKNNSIGKTVSTNLCIGCGVCTKICPTLAITLNVKQYKKIAHINNEKCINCGLCLKVCSGISVYEGDLVEDYYVYDFIHKSSIKQCHLVSTKIDSIREVGQSGGAITDFILQAIESLGYSGAFIAPPENLSYADKKLTLFSKREDIVQSAGSKYVIYSAEDVLEYIGVNEKYIVVSIPCHIQSIKKYCDLKKINDSNILYLGLFCDLVFNYALIDIIKTKFLDKNRDFISFQYRGKKESGWPGKLEFQYKDGVDSFDSKYRMFLKRFLHLERCLYCADKLNKFADISFGDCYIKEKSSIKGNSNIIIRTDKGLDFFNSLNIDNLNLQNIEYSHIFESQNYIKKKENLHNAFYLSDSFSIYPKARNIDSKINYRYYSYKKNYFILKFLRRKILINLLSSFSIKLLENAFRLNSKIDRLFKRLFK